MSHKKFSLDRLTILAIVSLIVTLIMAIPNCTSMAAGADHAAAPQAADPFPARPAHAPTGSEFLRSSQALDPTTREQAILAEIKAGNVPEHIRTLVPVQLQYRGVNATIYVLADYLAIGADDDYVIIPMTPRTAMQIARGFGFTLPTTKLVDDIYLSASVQLAPQPMRPGPAMASNAYYAQHDGKIKTQLSDATDAGALIAGHKKDVVLSPRLLRQPQRVAIYGWHRLDGQPIQSLSLVHDIDYVDYSHGVRLISRTAIIDGYPIDLVWLLADPDLNPLVSDEGAIPKPVYL